MEQRTLFLILFFTFLVALINGQYPNTIYELSNEDYDYDSDNDQNYLSDQPLDNKHKFDSDLLQEHLYNVKSNVLNGQHIFTLKDRNFTWSLYQNKTRSFQIENNKEKIVTKLKEKKTTDWFDIDGIQSDQPSSASLLNTDNQTSRPSLNEQFIKENSKSKELQSSSFKVNPPYVDVNSQSNQPYSGAIQPYPGVLYPRQNQKQQYSNVKPLYHQQPPYHVAPFNREWTCKIKLYDDCNITNDPQTGTMFQLKNHNYFSYEQSSGSNDWYLILNTSTIPANKIGGRLITPYIPFNKASKGCLTLHYLTTGNEIDKVIIHQQDIDNHCIWTSPPTITYQPLLSDRPIEKFIELSINFHNSDPRFFIEVYLKRLTLKRSSFALSKINLLYNQTCLNDQTNFCAPPLPSPTSQPKRYSNIIP